MRPVIPVFPFADLVVAGAQRWPDRDAFVVSDERRTYAEALEHADHVGRSLIALGVQRGDTVGILMHNCMDFIDALFGITLIGAVAVPINARFRAREIDYVVRDSGVRAVLTNDVGVEHVSLPERLVEALPGLDGGPALRHVVTLGSIERPGFMSRAEFDGAAGSVPAAAAEQARQRVAVRDIATMFYTSGTTAMPKGCLLPHEAMVRVGVCTRELMQLQDADRVWDPLPLFHSAATQPMAAILAVGGCYISMQNFDPAVALDQIAAERATVMFPAFPTITQALLNHPTYSDDSFRNVRVIFNVATPGALREMQGRMPHTIQVTAYGMTEFAGSVVMTQPTDDLDIRTETVGPPVPGVEIRIVSTETGDDLPTGEVGEVLVRGPAQFLGYHNAPEKNAEAVDAEGWFHSGDLGAVDDVGRLRYLGRNKDMLKVGGENVAALEIESYLMEHPTVSIAQVVGIPDDKYLEVAAAFIELKPGAAGDPDDIIAFCRQGLARFKVPHYVRFVDEWPMSATKIQKFRLRDQLVAELSAD